MKSKIIKKKTEKIYAFIDSQNLNLGINSLGWKLDFKKFRFHLNKKYQVEKAFLCIGYMPGNESLYTFLQSAGYILIFKPTLVYAEKGVRKVKGNVDAELVLHSMIEYSNYDKTVIVSGDGDFYCLVEYLVSKGKLFKLLVPNKKYSALLRKFAKWIVNVDIFRRKIEKK